MTLKELIRKEGRLCVFYPIENEYYLFIEGLDSNGNTIYSDFYTYSTLLKTVRVQIIKDIIKYDKDEVIDTLEAKLSTKVSDLVKEAKKIIKLKGEKNEIN